MLVTWFERSEWSVEQNSSTCPFKGRRRGEGEGSSLQAVTVRSCSYRYRADDGCVWDGWTVFRHLISQSRASAFRILINVWHGSAIMYEYSPSLWVKTKEWAIPVSSRNQWNRSSYERDMAFTRWAVNWIRKLNWRDEGSAGADHITCWTGSGLDFPWLWEGKVMVHSCRSRN